jgi:hypothetical protein
MQYRETTDVLEFVKLTVSFARTTTVRCDYRERGGTPIIIHIKHEGFISVERSVSLDQCLLVYAHT